MNCGGCGHIRPGTTKDAQGPEPDHWILGANLGAYFREVRLPPRAGFGGQRRRPGQTSRSYRPGRAAKNENVSSSKRLKIETLTCIPVDGSRRAAYPFNSANIKSICKYLRLLVSVQKEYANHGIVQSLVLWCIPLLFMNLRPPFGGNFWVRHLHPPFGLLSNRVRESIHLQLDDLRNFSDLKCI